MCVFVCVKNSSVESINEKKYISFPWVDVWKAYNMETMLTICIE